MKICGKCKKSKPYNEFYIDRRTKDGYYNACKICHNNRSNSYKNSHVEEEKTRWQNYSINNKIDIEDRRLKKKYGISLIEKDNLLKEQDYKCAICKCNQEQFKKSLHVDHNHVTGKVRGLLCVRCNNILGLVHERKEILVQCISYLESK